MSPRIFTVEQANRSLTLVRRIVSDLTGSFEKLKDRQEQLKSADEPGRKKLEEEVFDLQGAVERCVGELESVGCELKDIEQGLLDFYARNGDDLVFLCWKHGEERVDFWHGLQDGFPGRRPVSELPPETLYESVTPSAEKS